MLNLAVIGKDVSRSLSPSMHKFLLGKMGEPCSYEAVSVPPETFSARAEELFGKYDAFNVTIPFKTEIIPYLKELKGDAAAFGAVNTVLTRSRTGYNTDGYGFLLMLQNEGISPAGKSVLVLGAGGAGRSCIRKLSEAGADVYAYERSEDRLREVTRQLGNFTPLTRVPVRSYDMILNCTGIGMHTTVGKTPDVRSEASVEELLSLCNAAVDLIYEPVQSEFLRIAKSFGKQTVNGEAMLFYQAYMADCIYLDRSPSAEEAKALRNEYREGNG